MTIESSINLQQRLQLGLGLQARLAVDELHLCRPFSPRKAKKQRHALRLRCCSISDLHQAAQPRCSRGLFFLLRSPTLSSEIMRLRKAKKTWLWFKHHDARVKLAQQT